MTFKNLPSDLLADGDEALFGRLVAGELAEDERAAAVRRLETDPDFRRAYLKWSILETDLQTVLIDEPPPRARRVPGDSRRWQALVPWSIAAVAVAALAIGVLNWREATRQKPVATEQPEPSPPGQSEDPAGPKETIAVIVDAQDPPKTFPIGRRLSAGPVTLEDGHLLISFLGGATLFLEGPAELILRSTSDAELVRGRAAVRDSASVRSFRLNIPNASLVDLGTEFAVRTDPQGESIVRVQEGEVSVSVLDRDGTTWVSDVLRANDTVRLTPRGEKPIQADPSEQSFPRVPPVPRESLQISEEYVRAVQELHPVLYWRFEGLDEDGMIRDEGSLGCRGRLVNQGPSDSLTLNEGALHLRRTSQVRRVESERELPPVGSDSLTIELWAQTTEVGWQTMFGMLVPGFPGEQRSAAVLEFATNSGLVHSPMAIRGVCRTPSGRTGGTNLFGEDLWRPGGWHHIVLTRGGGMAKLYVDGRQVGQAQVSADRDLDRYFVVLGQLHAINWQQEQGLIRQFVGALDECAVYDRILSPEEIALHHRLGALRSER